MRESARASRSWSSFLFGIVAFAAATAACDPTSTKPTCPSAVAAATSAAPNATPSSAPAKLTFKKEGKLVRELTLEDLKKAIPPETVKQYDPYYSREKTFRAISLVKVLDLVFPNESISTVEFVFRASDGYTVPMRGALATEPGGYIAFEDADVPGWEPIGQQRANPAPFYVVWANKDQANTDTHPRPWQLATIEIAKFEEVFPHTAPTGADAAAQRGYAQFKQECVHCHAINREGGRVGPELNVPMSIVEYRPADQIKAYIRDPRTFRYSTMPAHDKMSEADLDDVIAYFTAMKDRKSDPDAGKFPSAPPPPSSSGAPSASASPSASGAPKAVIVPSTLPPLPLKDPLNTRD